MKIALLDTIHPVLRENFEQKQWFVDDLSKLSKEEILPLLPAYEGLIIRSRFPLDASFLNHAKKLKFIGRPGAGLENIDLVYCKSKNIEVFRSPEGNRDAVAEHAIGSLVGLLRFIPKANQEVKQGIWDRINNRGEEIMGKTIGIIGYGYMGEAFAKRLIGFGATVIAYDKYKSNFGTELVKEVSLEELKKQADIVSLHTPLTPETIGMVNDAFIQSFAKPFYLLNTARGQSVVLADLVKNLENGKVKGASLDVLEIEKTSFEEVFQGESSRVIAYLSQANNVILTPHVAGWTHQSNQKMADFLSKKILNHYTTANA